MAVYTCRLMISEQALGRWIEVGAGAVSQCVCQNFADERSRTFTVRWRGGKARLFGNAQTLLAFNKLRRLCSTLDVGNHI